MTTPWNFLRQFERLFEQTEVPPRFALWTGIAGLLAALERRVWINQGSYTIYPNNCIVLLAGSGQKKSTPINVCRKLLERMNCPPNIIAQKSTPEALIKKLQNSMVVDTGTGSVRERAGGVIIAHELATFFDKVSLERNLGPIFTSLYDCETFDASTIGRGDEVIKDGYLSLLGGITVELLRSFLPRDAIGGGFTSRMLFIYENRVAPPVAWIEPDNRTMQIEAELVEHLNEVAKLAGTIRVDQEAKEWYIEDYNDRYENHRFRQDPNLRAYESRRHTHLFKVSMALMVSEGVGLVMNLRHMQAADFILREAEEHLPHVASLISATDVGNQAIQVLNYILTHKVVPRAQIVKAFSNRLGADELSKIIDTLKQGGRIGVKVDGQGITYTAKVE